MHYVPNADLAFASVEYIMRDVNYGWLLRYMHANGASMFFLVVYVHIFRNLYYGSFSYPRNILWCTGVIILLIMILTAFMGYVLPWGQMSFWAATVITNLVSAVPVIGQDILIWLWGGFAVDNATLNRFFSFHYLFPFILAGLVGIHLIFLHENGSNNFLGIIFKYDKIPFTPYFTIKDIYGIILFFILFSYFIFFDPIYLGHPDNFIVANPLVTPNHIVPEWYFLPFYAILRSVPDKLIGVLLLLASILILLFFPFLTKANIVSGYFRPFYQYFFWIFFYNCILLGWIGGKVIEEPFYLLGQIFTFYYFSYFIFILPFLGFIENKLFIYFNVKKFIFSFQKHSFINISINKYSFFKNYNENISLTQASNIKNFFYVLVFFFLYSQTVLLYNGGDRVPGILTFFVFFLLYFFLPQVKSGFFSEFVYKKNIWFLSYINFIFLLNSLFILFLQLVKKIFINLYFYKHLLINKILSFIYLNFLITYNYNYMLAKNLKYSDLFILSFLNKFFFLYSNIRTGAIFDVKISELFFAKNNYKTYFINN